jgi:hypothetical protein
MNTVHAQFVCDKAVLLQEELRRLLELARRAEEIELRIENEDIPTMGLETLSVHLPIQPRSLAVGDAPHIVNPHCRIHDDHTWQAYSRTRPRRD